MAPIVEKKNFLRNDILQKRLKLPFEEVFRLSSIIQKKFWNLREFKQAHQIALYASFKNEVLTDTILEYAITHGKEVFFPRVVRGKKGLIFLKVTGKQDLVPGSYEIQEPIHNKIEQDSFDIMVVPGIAFDKSGNRLGYGKGYYDKVLHSIKGKCLIVAFAYNFQITDMVPAEEHDVKVNKIITESRVFITERGE
ncbi:MAG TPA: 5-formyltetrahydrofolate cyclo-ligase [Deltaproteobacteria bacterium]|nr:5-formyltetrahydrofolate cyclo-ligase [Deltaproteobacteria bacterium]HCY18616.1 5-formyltetrahydrofolate cyclo-ligase [Deltaproteobacteria bacterium]